ncbi:uncharacterized protein LOC114329039 [Diabrotica virgifera virgifera]|uniref:Uncharacterized protein LOC114329039 n=1 Tax=Diabrotica virgifera virgifera TaxID=50390 RepID=A0A6P7FG13_DIAVI|nr:uncharacterized protein LOC114329039 [Diabrotica virgifera virgifera]
MNTALVLTLLFCVGLTVNAKTANMPEKPTHHPPTPEPEPDPEEFQCDACITFATVIDELVEERLPLDEVERDASLICRILPGTLGEFCEQHLLPKVDKIYEECHKHEPQDVCDRLDFC